MRPEERKWEGRWLVIESLLHRNFSRYGTMEEVLVEGKKTSTKVYRVTGLEERETRI